MTTKQQPASSATKAEEAFLVAPSIATRFRVWYRKFAKHAGDDPWWGTLSEVEHDAWDLVYHAIRGEEPEMAALEDPAVLAFLVEKGWVTAKAAVPRQPASFQAWWRDTLGADAEGDDEFHAYRLVKYALDPEDTPVGDRPEDWKPAERKAAEAFLTEKGWRPPGGAAPASKTSKRKRSGVQDSEGVRAEIARVRDEMVAVDPNLTDEDRAVYGLMAARAIDLGLFDVIAPPTAFVERVGIPRTAVQRVHRRLEKHGYILKWARDPKTGKPNFTLSRATAAALQRWPRPGSRPATFRMQQPRSDRRDPSEFVV